MGKIIWTVNGPFEQLDWGGLVRVPPDDPRIRSKSSLQAALGNDVDVDIDAEGNVVNKDKDTDMDKETGKRTREQAGIDQSAGPSTGGRRTIRSEPEPTMNDSDMPDAGDPGQGQLALRSSGPNSVSKETPISNYPGLTYGLQETHTTILPWTGWLSVGGLGKTTPQQLKIRMNAPWDMLDVTTVADATPPGLQSSGFSRMILGHRGQATTATFPEQFTASATTATERPQWRDYWSEIYGWYTVLGCDWEVIVHNPLVLYQLSRADALAQEVGPPQLDQTVAVNIPTKVNGDVVCAVQYDSYSDTATSTGNVMPLTRYSEIRNFKNIQWYPCPDGGRKTVIRGHYKPGMIKRNIVNDGDVKTWTATGTTLPNLKEILTLNFFQDPFSNAEQIIGENGSSTNANQNIGVNMEINLKYIVQFKDLKLQARYPNSVTASQDLRQDLAQAAGTDEVRQKIV